MARTLDVPTGLDQVEDLDEILRVWIGDGDLHLTMHDFFGPDARQWGMVLADVAMHIARLRLEQQEIAEQETLGAIEAGYRQRMAEQDGISHHSLTGRH